MLKNTASQKLTVYAFDSTTNLPKTGDAANLTAYVSKDDGSLTVLGDTSATEVDATNAKGYYVFDLTQAETNADKLLFTCKSGTANIVPLAMPAVVYTVPANFTKLVIDASGLADANAVKVGPTGSGTAQTARDLGASVLLSPGTGTGQIDLTSGIPKANMTQILGTAVSTPATAGILDVNVKNLNNVSGSAITTVKAVQGLAVDGVIPTATNLTNAPTNGDLTAAMKASVNAEADTALADVGLTSTITGRVDAAVSTRATPAQVNTEVVDALVTDVIADSIPADGSRPSIAQALYMIGQFLLERSVSGTTMTVKKADGSTTLFTITLNDATAPTALTRTT